MEQKDLKIPVGKLLMVASRRAAALMALQGGACHHELQRQHRMRVKLKPSAPEVPKAEVLTLHMALVLQAPHPEEEVQMKVLALEMQYEAQTVVVGRTVGMSQAAAQVRFAVLTAVQAANVLLHP